MFGNKIKLSMTHDEIRVLVYALNELRNALTGPEPARNTPLMVPHYIAKK